MRARSVMNRVARRTAALALAWVALAGCMDAPFDEPPEATLEVGTGTYRFEPVADGAPVPLIRGAQGGWHLWVAIRVHGLDESTGSLEVVHYPIDAPDAPARVSLGVHLDPPNADGFRAYLGWPAILSDPACAVGHLYRIEATFRPASGGRLTASRDMLVDPGELPPPECER